MLFFISLAFLFFNFTGRETEKQRRRETGSREAAGKRRQSAGLVCPGRAGLFLCSRSGRAAGSIPGGGRPSFACLSSVRLAAVPSGAAVCFPAWTFFSCLFPAAACAVRAVCVACAACRRWWWRWWWCCPLLYIIFILFFAFILYTGLCCFLRCGLLCLPARRLLCWAAVCVARSSAKTKK